MITIIAILGKTSTSKDTIARYMKKVYNIEPVVSYTTRPIRSSEIEGREHYFITDTEMDAIIVDKDSLLAFTQFPETGYRYCATTKSISDDKVMSYIIDPAGLEWLRENRPDVRIIAICTELEDDMIIERAKNRGDDPEAIAARLSSESDMFDSFINTGSYNAKIYTGTSVEEIYEKVDSILSACNILPIIE